MNSGYPSEKKYTVKRITTDEEYQKALKDLQTIFDFEHVIDGCEAAYLEALALEIVRYERELFLIPEPTLWEQIMFRLDQQSNKTMSILERIIIVLCGMLAGMTLANAILLILRLDWFALVWLVGTLGATTIAFMMIKANGLRKG